MSKFSKTFSSFLFIFLLSAAQGLSLGFQDRLSVSPATLTISVSPGQTETKIFEVKNPGSKYISVKSQFDTSWISLYPSKFILLPSETKRVMAIFSVKKDTPLRQPGKIIFRSPEGEEKIISVTFSDNPDYISVQTKKQADTGDKKAAATIPAKPKKQTVQKQTEESPKDLSKRRGNTETKKEISKPLPVSKPTPTKNTSFTEPVPKDYQLLIDSLKTEIAQLERKLKTSEEETAKLIEQIQQQDKRISDLLGNLSEDMIADLRDLFNFSSKYFKKEIENNSIHLKWFGNKFSIMIDGPSSFSSGSVGLSPSGKKILAKIASIIKTKGKYEKMLTVHGHTDSQPISYRLKNKIPTNWELSSLRAVSVVRVFEEELGVPGKDLSLSAFSYHRPIASDRTAQGRAKNRRIEIFITCQSSKMDLFVKAKEEEG